MTDQRPGGLTSEPADSSPASAGQDATGPIGRADATQPIDLERTGAVRTGEGTPPPGPRWSAPQSQAPQSQAPHGQGSRGPGARLPGGVGGPGAPSMQSPQRAAAAPPPPSGAAPVTTTSGGPPSRRGVLAVGGALIALVAGAAGGVAGATLFDRDETADDDNDVLDAGRVAQLVLPGVVTFKIGQGEGTGSGFVMRQDGYLITNNHVASARGEATQLTAVFADGSELPAKVVGRDASYDLAVVKVDKTGLPPVPFGSSEAVEVGDPVVALGAPLGLESTVTSGIVSAVNRPVVTGQNRDQQSYISAIQTDAAINPGNSGGPLVDSAGRVIGVNTAIARVPGSTGGTGGNIGVGFAIPSDTAKRTAEQLISRGKAQHPVIGASVDQSYAGPGARIAASGSTPAVTPGGPAAKAGLKDGDVILRIDDRKVTSSSMLIVSVRAKAVGDTVRLLVRSGSSERTVAVVLAGADG